MVSAYSLPGTVLPKRKLENGEYAVACLVPGTVHFKKEVLISECVMVNFTLMVYPLSIKRENVMFERLCDSL